MDNSLKKQHVIKFIPIIQFITVFCWINCFRKNNVKYGEFLKYALLMILFLLLINIPRIILHFIFSNDMLDNIMFYVSIYPSFLSVSLMAVTAQKSMKKYHN